MPTYQLDECTNSGKLKRSCEKEGNAKLRRFPKAMANRAVADRDVLNWLKDLDTPLLTTDIWMKVNHASDMPETHPGIVVLASAESHPLTNRSKLAVLGQFKTNFPKWNQVPLNNSFLEIWKAAEYNVCVALACGGVVSNETLLSYTDDGWKERLEEILRRNAGDGDE